MTVQGRPGEQAAPTADDRHARKIFAAAGAAFSILVLFAYYVPGLLDNTDTGGLILVLAVPAAALAMPFALLALVLRTKAIWIAAGVLMLLVVGGTTVDLMNGEDEGVSLLLFFIVFITNMTIVGIAAIIDVAYRAGRKQR